MVGLYFAGCSGYDFTKSQSGIPGIGIKMFIEIVNKTELPLSATSLGEEILEHVPHHAKAAGLNSLDAVSSHLQHMVNIYTCGKLYNNESGIIGMIGVFHAPVDSKSKQHMQGTINSRTLQEFEQSMAAEKF